MLMKKVLLVISILTAFVSLVLCVNAHSGGTDGSGGHTDHSTGEYHYHHGYPAHDHYDMDNDGDLDCPYDFKDKTEDDLDIDFLPIPTFDFDSFTVPTDDNYIKQPEKNEKESDSNGKSTVVPIVICVLLVGFWISPIFFKNRK